MEVVTWAADKWANRQRLVIRADTESKFLVGVAGGSWFHSCSGAINVYNAGPNRVTVTEGWFEAKDGTRVMTHVPRAASLTPGDPELWRTSTPTS